MKITSTLPWLALFGLVHGFHEWIEMFQVIHPFFKENVLIEIITFIVLSVSSYFLIIFGLLLIAKLTEKRKIFFLHIPIFLIWIITIIIIIPGHPFNVWFTHAENLTRYLFYFTGALLSATALFFQYLDLKKQNLKHIAWNFFISTVLFLFIGIFAGLIGEPSIFFPANTINSVIFLDIFGFPVQLIRGFLAIFIAIFIIRGLSIFDIEEEKKFRRLRDSEKAALDESERLTKQYSMLYQQQKNIASTLQKSLLPIKTPRLKDYNIGIHYRSASAEAAIGGDFYDFITDTSGTMHIIVGDVSGKGIKAAAETCNIKSLMNHFLLGQVSPSEVMERLNSALFLQYKASKFFTVVITTYNPNEKTLTIVNAGHPFPIRYSDINKEISTIEKSGTALAVVDNEIYPAKKLSVDETDLLIFYTDGLTEARHDSELFGEERVIEAVEKIKELSAQEIADNLGRVAVDFSGNVLYDDLLILVMKKL